MSGRSAGSLVSIDICAVCPFLKLVHGLLRCLHLAVHSLERIRADSTAERRILHDSQIVEDLGGLRWVTGLGVMPVLCVLLRVDVVVSVVLDFAEFHAAT